MSEREPTLRDVLGAVNELRGEMGEVRIGLGDVRGRLDRVDGRLDGLTDEVETLRTDLPAQVVAGVLVGFERSAYATDLRTLQA